jgi:hypothetical protein
MTSAKRCAGNSAARAGDAIILDDKRFTRKRDTQNCVTPDRRSMERPGRAPRARRRPEPARAGGVLASRDLPDLGTSPFESVHIKVSDRSLTKCETRTSADHK